MKNGQRPQHRRCRWQYCAAHRGVPRAVEGRRGARTGTGWHDDPQQPRRDGPGHPVAAAARVASQVHRAPARVGALRDPALMYGVLAQVRPPRAAPSLPTMRTYLLRPVLQVQAPPTLHGHGHQAYEQGAA
ncbi:hypothetical protein ON010_g14316 [Phytophthora cinnamomi]|nr:hypothetical protein ON010_g14316 [Phytophthora cinnamomi]